MSEGHQKTSTKKRKRALATDVREEGTDAEEIEAVTPKRKKARKVAEEMTPRDVDETDTVDSSKSTRKRGKRAVTSS